MWPHLEMTPPARFEPLIIGSRVRHSTDYATPLPPIKVLYSNYHAPHVPQGKFSKQIRVRCILPDGHPLSWRRLCAPVHAVAPTVRSGRRAGPGASLAPLRSGGGRPDYVFRRRVPAPLQVSKSGMALSWGLLPDHDNYNRITIRTIRTSILDWCGFPGEALPLVLLKAGGSAVLPWPQRVRCCTICVR